MLIFNILRALNRVKDKRGGSIYEVANRRNKYATFSSKTISRTDWSIFNYIKILFVTIVWSLLLLGCLILATDMKYEFFCGVLFWLVYL